MLVEINESSSKTHRKIGTMKKILLPSKCCCSQGGNFLSSWERRNIVAGSRTEGVVITDCQKASKKTSLLVAIQNDSRRDTVL